MQVTHYFEASLTSPAVTTISVMQGCGRRMIVAGLMEGTKPWPVPEGVKAGVSYELPGKDPGYYDLLGDGTPACVIEGNQVSVVLEPVLMERPGPVKVSIILRDPDGVQVATFPFHLWVERVPGLVNGENLQAPPHIFDGKIYYGGAGGGLLPLGLGAGIWTEEQADGSILLVAACGEDLAAHDHLLPKNLGAENVGKVLVVGTDGNIVLTELPQGGDVTGTLDESNNILLFGDLADGTYTLKWRNADGTYSDAGTIVVGQVGPAYINQIPISTDAAGELFVGPNGETGYKPGYRLSMTSGTEKVAEGYSVTGFIPVKHGDVIRIKNITVTEDSNINIAAYDSNRQPINGGTTTYGTSLHRLFVEFGTEENGVCTATLTGAVHGAFAAEELSYIRIGSTSITNESVITINQEIV